MKKKFFVVSFHGASKLVLAINEMKEQDWEAIADDLKGIRVIERTQKWKDSLPEWDG